MHLRGQDSQRGYAMAALLVSVGVMMLLMSAAMPVWRHEAQREREAELVFRGQQYARAVNLYTRKAGPGNFPPSIDILVQQRFLRKKYKDPMVKDGEFEIITAATVQQGQQGQPGVGPNQGGTARGGAPSNPFPGANLNAPGPSISTRPGGSAFGNQNGSSPFAGGQQGGAGGGIMGVRSKSKETSIRQYNGSTHYNEWSFLFSTVSNRPGGRGGNAGGSPMPGVGNGSPFPGNGRGGRGPGGGGGAGGGGAGGGGGTGGARGSGGFGSGNTPGPFQQGRRGGG
jgi:type II secretory pathway pseudopilin PulG